MDLWPLVPAPWQVHLAPVRAELRALALELTARSQQGERNLPRPEAVFRALDKQPADVRVLILGQDPYPNPEHAMGLAFGVPAGTRPLPPTLRNILAELRSDLGREPMAHDDLSSWSQQGVLLLNRSLTVTAGSPGAHANLGWHAITDCILRAVDRPDLVAVLWGNAAQSAGAALMSAQKIVGVHPSPLSAHRGFFGSKPFSAVNEKLGSLGQEPISW